ncbi:phage portal protein [Serratia ureilytica]|uniref:Phage portal protein n=1 Tax=Serratia ureilytica TaxID=300181 RepID=A0A9X9BZK7_9GAMM|nr:phage portal protein [Serratia ureilytica]TXE26919.1 phage portal protein [Serratia ureilytica]
MGRKKRNYAKTTATPQASAEAFAFGDPVPMLDQRDIFGYLECPIYQQWYEPPLSFDGLARSYWSAVHHSSPLQVKRNILVSTLKPTPMISPQEFSKFALNYLIFGNSYLELRKNKLNQGFQLLTSPAKYTRRGVERDQYWYVQDMMNPYRLPVGQVFHLLEPDINQEIYGLPEYLAGLNSTWLNESATLFRRKYYENGNHAGFIMYLTDPTISQASADAIRKALADSKGMNNFKNLFINAPNGKADGIQIIPLSEIAAKDDFFNIKRASRDDQLSAHRVPPQLMGIVPEKNSGFGDVEKASMVFVRNELVPLQMRMQEVNHWLGEEVIAFNEYKFITPDPA